MAPRNPEFVRRRLFAHFDDPPRLSFAPPGFTRLDYRTPDLERDPDAYAEFDTDQPSPQRHDALKQLQAIVKAAAERLDYAETTMEEWEHYVRFATDRVIKVGDELHVEESQPAPVRRFVNDTREDALTWFLDELVPIIDQDRRSHIYLLGEPGAGKSTLLKYLITRNAPVLWERGVVFSRFEFIKFCDRFFSGDIRQIRTDLSIYIAFLLLRDLLWTKAYGFGADGRRMRIWPTRALRDIVARGLERHGLREEALVDQITLELDAALGPDKIDFPRLRAIKPWIKALLIDHLREGCRIGLVIDGLDCVAFEDSAFEAERHQILEKILELRPRLTELAVPVIDPSRDDSPIGAIEISVPASLIFIMRENTFFQHGDGLRRDVPLVQRKTFHIGNIDPEVALLNIARRGSALWAAKSGASEATAEEHAQLVMRGLYTAFRFLARALRAGDRHHELLRLFCGNLRHLFNFMERLVAWVLDDAISEDLLSIGAETQLDDVLHFLISPNGREVLRRRSYRLIEILLFYRLPWFEPLVKPPGGRLTDELLSVHGAKTFKDNRFFTGFIDNIFNYHVRQHRLGDDLHPLLEKIRIVQLLTNESMNADSLAEVMDRRLGYEPHDLVVSLRFLLRAQFIQAQVIENDVLLRATPRGELVVTHLARSMTYIEHVYHQTLFPADFLPVRKDVPRERGVENWTAHSIRNCFIFLAYLRFVESNRAKGRRVPGELRLYQATLDQVRRSIVRIVGDPDEPIIGAPAEARQLAIAADALRLVENTLSHWDKGSYIAEYGGRGAPATI